ncbi:hypothetical protein D3C79_1027730 [compost metagenome]
MAGDPPVNVTSGSFSQTVEKDARETVGLAFTENEYSTGVAGQSSENPTVSLTT